MIIDYYVVAINMNDKSDSSPLSPVIPKPETIVLSMSSVDDYSHEVLTKAIMNTIVDNCFRKHKNMLTEWCGGNTLKLVIIESFEDVKNENFLFEKTITFASKHT